MISGGGDCFILYFCRKKYGIPEVLYMYSLYYKIPVFFKEYVERDFSQSDSVQTTGLKKGMLKYYLKMFGICLRVFLPFLNIC